MSDRVDRALESMSTGPSGGSWEDPRTVVRRRRAASASALAVVLVAALVAIVVPRLGSDSAAPPAVPVAAGVTTGDHLGSAVQLVGKTAPLTSADPAAVSALAAAEQDFTARLLQQLPASDENVSTSPASLALALAMLQNGASGQTLAEISAALGTDVSAANEGWAGLVSSWADAAKSAGIDFSSANSLWQQRGLALRAPFVNALTRYFDSGVWQVDFANNMPGALDALNTWTSEHTNGKITKLFDSLDPSTVLVLANAVYFKAAWQTPFNAEQTEPGPFAGPSGRSTVQFMHSPGDLMTATTSTYEAAQIPYQDGRFAALAIMPTNGSLSDFIAGMDGHALEKIASLLSTRTQVWLPRFTTTSMLDLESALKGLGIKQAWTDAAQFAGMSTTRMQLGQAIQRVFLKVGEKGTEAAAATGLGMRTYSLQVPPAHIAFDKPFLFLVRDTKTGAVLFASQIVSPDAAS